MNLSNVTFKNNFGHIQYLENIHISRDINLIRSLIILNNSIFVNSSAIPELNSSALIEFYNTRYKYPVPYRDGIICPFNICSERNFDSNSKTYSFIVSSFSTYSINDSYCGDNSCNVEENCNTCSKDCGICTRSSSGGGSSGGGVFIPKTNNVISNTSSNNTISNTSINTVVPSRNNTLSDANSQDGVEHQSLSAGNGTNDESKDVIVESPLQKPRSIFSIVGIMLAIIIIIVVFITLLSYKHEDKYTIYSDYLDNMRGRGMTNDQIRQWLKSNGWSDKQVDNLFNLDQLNKP